jgi:hypothetical protein
MISVTNNIAEVMTSDIQAYLQDKYGVSVDDHRSQLELAFANALEHPNSSGMLAIDSDNGEITFINTFQVITSLVGILGSIVAFAGANDFIAMCAFVAALGAINGYKSQLQAEQGVICKLLFEAKDGQMPRNQLQTAYEDYLTNYPKPGAGLDEFDDALVNLGNLGCITTKNGVVTLNQLIMVF